MRDRSGGRNKIHKRHQGCRSVDTTDGLLSVSECTSPLNATGCWLWPTGSGCVRKAPINAKARCSFGPAQRGSFSRSIARWPERMPWFCAMAVARCSFGPVGPAQVSRAETQRRSSRSCTPRAPKNMHRMTSMPCDLAARTMRAMAVAAGRAWPAAGHQAPRLQRLRLGGCGISLSSVDVATEWKPNIRFGDWPLASMHSVPCPPRRLHDSTPLYQPSRSRDH